MLWTQGQSGNPDGARKPKKFMAALERAMALDDAKRLRQCAETVLDLAAAGEQWAVLLLRDTLDGKPAQQVIATDEDGRGLAVALISYAEEVRPDDTLSLPAPSLPAPDIAEPGQRD